MRKTVRTYLWWCDVCNSRGEVHSREIYGDGSTRSNHSFPNWFARHIHFGTDVCASCKSIIRNAREATNTDPLIDLVNRKQKIQGEQS